MKSTGLDKTGLDKTGLGRHTENEMLKRSSKKNTPKDPNELAAFIVEEATKEPVGNFPQKNPAAVALGRLGGKKGGLVRANKLTAAQRSEIARKAAVTRWHGR